jgi:hypothetical protein
VNKLGLFSYFIYPCFSFIPLKDFVLCHDNKRTTGTKICENKGLRNVLETLKNEWSTRILLPELLIYSTAILSSYVT